MGVLWIGGAKRYRGELMRTTAVFSLPTPPPPQKKRKLTATCVCEARLVELKNSCGCERVIGIHRHTSVRTNASTPHESTCHIEESRWSVQAIT